MSLAPVIHAIEKAIQAEIEGHHFYRMAAGATTDPQGREVFETLAAEELHHAEFLRTQHRSLEGTGRIDPSASLGDPLALVGSSPIFSVRLKARAAQAHFEMTALSVGIQLEADAQAFYRRTAEEASAPEVKAFLLRLAEWESGHYHGLLAQQKTLEEEYWAANRFAPF
jgi:rubrerythrin